MNFEVTRLPNELFTNIESEKSVLGSYSNLHYIDVCPKCSSMEISINVSTGNRKCNKCGKVGNAEIFKKS